MCMSSTLYQVDKIFQLYFMRVIEKNFVSFPQDLISVNEELQGGDFTLINFCQQNAFGDEISTIISIN